MDKPARDFADHRIETADLVVNFLREGSGPPLVLLHGWPEFCRSWKKNITALAARFDVIAPDLRGFGDTRRKDGKPAEKTTAGLLSADLTAFLDALGLSRVGIVSHDVGAYVAQTFARFSPDRVAALFFFNCPYPGVGSRVGARALICPRRSTNISTSGPWRRNSSATTATPAASTSAISCTAGRWTSMRSTTILKCGSTIS